MVPIKWLLLLLAFLSSCTLYAQTGRDSAFEIFALKQNDLFVKAYEKRDTLQYKFLLAGFLPRYNALTKNQKETYKEFYANAYYNLCCTYALLNDKPDALVYLSKAVTEGGYNDYSHLQSDSDLNSIRTENEYIQLVQPLKETGDYLYILKKYGAYDSDDKRTIPSFQYQSSQNEHLVALRNAFHLDSIAGSGNDVSKVISLMHWIHNLIPHDGNHNNPDVKNAMSMIAVCKRNNRGLNCRGLATVLNECYLSMGFASRFITCLPKDSLGTDPDCHVINSVYIPSLKKWIWIDPTNDAYVMDEKGDLLGIEEVRERLVDDKPLLINPDANWNHKSSVAKEEYLYRYMAKNLYQLECPVVSEYDTETSEPMKTIVYAHLLPTHHFKKMPGDIRNTNSKSGVTYETVYTTNSSLFWQLPQ